MPTPPLRVVHITASSLIGGGPEHVWQLLQHLPQKRIESYVAAPQKQPYWDRFVESAGLGRCQSIPQRRWSLAAFVRLVHWLREQRIQIIHSHGRGAGIYGRLASLVTGVPCVHSFHGIHVPQAALPRVLYLLEERILASVSRVNVTVSPSEGRLVVNFGLQGKRLLIIPNGVEVRGGFKPSPVPSPFTIVHVSRFDDAKNSDALVPIARAMRERGILDACRFILVGDGAGRAKLEARLAAEDLLPYFLFTGPQNGIRLFLRGAGCYLSTSLGEGLPLAVLEAQAEGVPAVVSRVPGNVDAVIADETGLLFPLDDPEAAVACIQRIMDDALLRERMGLAAFEHVKANYTVERMAMIMADLYISVSDAAGVGMESRGG